MVKWSRHRPFKAVTRVRLPLGPPFYFPVSSLAQELRSLRACAPAFANLQVRAITRHL